MPKAFMNKAGKLVAFEKGKPVASDQPAIFPDEIKADTNPETLKALHGKPVDTKGLKLVDVDVIIDKPQPRYVIKKSK
jgi:hypothetical protein